MEIVYYPHPALRWKSKAVTEIDAKLRSIAREMCELMYEAGGIGLAANQIGLPYRLFVMNPTGDRDLRDQEFVFINPEISRRKGSAEGQEGCLSLPELYGQVRRAEQITIEAFDLKGREFTLQLDELPGRVAQHEYDHLDGILFPDRMSEAARREIEPELAEFESRYQRLQRAGEIPPNSEIERRLREIEPK